MTAEEYRFSRVGNAEKALSVYTDRDRNANVTDCIADLMHWSREKGIDFDRCLERATEHYETESRRLHEELGREEEEAKDEELGLER
jgi:hypothetical protein